MNLLQLLVLVFLIVIFVLFMIVLEIFLTFIMPGSIKKDLYLAKSVHALNELASNIPKVNSARMFVRILSLV